jgi:hypothetical protein
MSREGRYSMIGVARTPGRGDISSAAIKLIQALKKHRSRI